MITQQTTADYCCDSLDAPSYRYNFTPEQERAILKMDRKQMKQFKLENGICL